MSFLGNEPPSKKLKHSHTFSSKFLSSDSSSSSTAGLDHQNGFDFNDGSPVTTTKYASSSAGFLDHQSGFDFNDSPPVAAATCPRSSSSVSSIPGFDYSESDINQNKTIKTKTSSSKPYKSLNSSQQYKLKQKVASELDALLSKYNLNDYDDNSSFFAYYHNQSYNSEDSKYRDEIITAQYKSLSLADRTELTRLLSLKEGQPNEEILHIFPSLRNKANYEAERRVRKVRHDKIELDFISEFMHGHCRYLCGHFCTCKCILCY
jgi:hypothetical protein